MEYKIRQFFQEAAQDGFELRPGQLAMALEVWNEVNWRRNLAVEAEVGIGKSFAYLVPALLQYALDHRQIVIATSTIALQEQLAKDVHTVMQRLGVEYPVTIAKGMKNYACMKRVSAYYRKHHKDTRTRQIWKHCFGGIQERSALGMNIDDALWDKLRIQNYGGHQCRGCNCTSNCVYKQMRTQISVRCGIVICHHNMLISHLFLQQSGRYIFCRNLSTIIVDEAHNLETRFREAYTSSYDKNDMISLIKACADGDEERDQHIMETKADLQLLFRLLKDQIKEQQARTDGDAQSFYLHHTREIDRLLQCLKHDLMLIAPEDELSKQLERFQSDTSSVILGSGTYWEGINVTGESLSQVIIFKLPFPVPDPIIDYKMSLTEHAMDDVLIPEMITKLRQGAGRLIRSEADCGIVSVLDPRINLKSKRNYVGRVLDALPMKRRTGDMTEIQRFWNYLQTERSNGI